MYRADLWMFCIFAFNSFQSDADQHIKDVSLIRKYPVNRMLTELLWFYAVVNLLKD